MIKQLKTNKKMKWFLFILIFVSYIDIDAQTNGYIVGNSWTVYKTTNSGVNLSFFGGGGTTFGTNTLNDIYLTAITTSISYFSIENILSIYPNPVQSVINVKADSKLIGDVYAIYDNTGRVVLTGKINLQNTIIELGNLSAGI